jgi:predicted transcriptional regulator
MTTLTINLSDDIVATLDAQATARRITLEAYIQECLADFTLNDVSQLDPVDLTPDELLALESAREDLAAGRTVSHKDAMAHFARALAR